MQNAGQCPPSEPQKEDASMKSNAMRAFTSVELQELERKCAYDLQMHVQSFLYFPTPDNFGRIQECANRYINAWMNGRKRVLSD